MARKPRKLRRPRAKKNTARFVAELLVKTANSNQNPLEKLEALQKFDRNGLEISITCHKSADLEKPVSTWAFNLVETNMREMYEQSSWGWDEDEKKFQLNHKAAKFLIAQDNSGKNVGFVHFRFEVELDEPVLYCYEIQLEKDVQRKGLGRFLMQILQLMSFQFNMKKVMLTVFKHNTIAMDFYINHLGFEIDETSPSQSFEDECYEILSKESKPRIAENV